MNIIGGVFIIFTLLLVPSSLSSHENHWYDHDCCDDKDCEPIIEYSWKGRVLTYSTTKYKNVVIDLDALGKKYIRASQDDKMHACTIATADDLGSQMVMITRCLYFPGAS